MCLHTLILQRLSLAKVRCLHKLIRTCADLCYVVLPAVGASEIVCSANEFVHVVPPAGKTCGEYMQAFISSTTGYLTNPEGTVSCQFCPFRTTDEFLGSSFSIFYSRRWRDAAVVCGYIVINVRFIPHIVLCSPNVLTTDCAAGVCDLFFHLVVPCSKGKEFARGGKEVIYMLQFTGTCVVDCS